MSKLEFVKKVTYLLRFLENFEKHTKEYLIYIRDRSICSKKSK